MKEVQIKTVGDMKIFLHEPLGKGSFGSVYKGSWKEHTVVAIKVIEKNIKMSKAEINNEIDIMTKLKHKNIV
jgi:serine/threonine protein kinase